MDDVRIPTMQVIKDTCKVTINTADLPIWKEKGFLPVEDAAKVQAEELAAKEAAELAALEAEEAEEAAKASAPKQAESKKK